MVVVKYIGTLNSAEYGRGYSVSWSIPISVDVLKAFHAS